MKKQHLIRMKYLARAHSSEKWGLGLDDVTEPRLRAQHHRDVGEAWQSCRVSRGPGFTGGPGPRLQAPPQTGMSPTADSPGTAGARGSGQAPQAGQCGPAHLHCHAGVSPTYVLGTTGSLPINHKRQSTHPKACEN